MSILQYQMLLSILIPLVLVGCSNSNNTPHKTLSLSLVNSEGKFHVTDYRVLDHPFRKSQQQGLYQAHLIDEDDNILQRISFEKLEIPASQNGSGNAGFYVALPLKPDLNRVTFYKLDGSSGHYQLKADDPLLNWTLPEGVKEKSIATQK